MTKSTLESIAEEENRNNILLRALLVRSFPSRETASEVGLPGLYTTDRSNKEIVPRIKLKLLNSTDHLVKLYEDYFKECGSPIDKEAKALAHARAIAYESYQTQYAFLTNELISKLVKAEDKK